MSIHSGTESKKDEVISRLPEQTGAGKNHPSFNHNETEAGAVNKMQETANGSYRVKQLRAYQAMANSSARTKQLVAYQAMANNSTPVKQRKAYPTASKQLSAQTVQLKPIGQERSGLENQLALGAEILAPVAVQGIKPAQIIQRVKEGEKIPSVEKQTHSHFQNNLSVAEHSDNPDLQAAHFLEKRSGVEIKHVPNETESKKLSEALLGTKFVEEYLLDLRAILERGYRPPSMGVSPRPAEWKDKLQLENTDIEYETSGDDGSGGYQPYEEDKGSITESLKKADEIVKSLVSAEVLKLLPAPKVKIVAKSGHRAYHSGNLISVAHNDAPEIVVHEIGHYLESNLPSALYHDVALLREKRDSGVGGFMGFNKEYGIAVKGKTKEMGDDEVRYPGAYPATGEYTSKVYDHGATEVVSMTMQYLAKPDTLKNLLTQDPVQASVVLRHIKPDDAELQELFNKFKEFLPFDYGLKEEKYDAKYQTFNKELLEPLLPK